MEKRKLGRTGLNVTVIGFGGLPMQRCSPEEAQQVLTAAIDSGINFVDTARAYTDSEEKIGNFLSARRQEFYLATKSMARDRISMAKDIDISLQTLKTEYIDLYQVHNIKKAEDLDAVLAPGGALEALKDAQAAGKIGHIGITGHNVEYLIKALKTNNFSTVQVPFNCIETTAAQELFPLAAAMNIGRIVMKPLGGGQISNVNLALRYIVDQNITVAIPGMDEVKQVQENVAAAKPFRPLTAAEQQILMAEANEIGTEFCRRCGYCLPCTKGIEIPQVFIFHLQYTRYGLKDAIPKRYAALKAKASDCIQCGICEKKCPYDFPIMKRMAQIAKDLG